MEGEVGMDDDINMSDDEAHKPDGKVSSPIEDEANGTMLKRKRPSDQGASETDAAHSISKRQRSVSPYPPPPPPPPPAESPAGVPTLDQMEDLKRKREDYDEDEGYGDSASSPGKRQRSESPPPPPPPPPPGDDNSPGGRTPILEDDVEANAAIHGRDDAITYSDDTNGGGCNEDKATEAARLPTESPDPLAD